MNQTFICCSTYHIYISILEAYKNKKAGNKSLIILIIDKIEGAETLLSVLKNIGVFDKVTSIKAYSITDKMKEKMGFLNFMFNRSNALVDLFEKNNPELQNHTDFILNSELNLFEINRTRAYFIIKYPNNFMRMHEDGIGAYRQKLSPIRIFNRKYITRFPLLKGHDKQVREFVVRQPDKIFDTALKDKTVKLDLLALEKGLTTKEKNQIVTAFLGKDILFDSNSNNALVVTQPLENGVMKNQDKLNMYQKMIDDALSNECTIYFKNHPRDVTDYKAIFGDKINIIPRLFPLEIFNLSSDFNFKRGYTINSTALGNLKYVEEKMFLDKLGQNVYN